MEESQLFSESSQTSLINGNIFIEEYKIFYNFYYILIFLAENASLFFKKR